jgi:AcrR family transcriptional regulator
VGRAEQTRARLLDATAEVVRESGYAKATTRAIAARAGLTEGAIYRHFPNKAALFFAALLERNKAVVGWVEEFPDRAGTGTVRDNLVDAVRTLSELRHEVVPFEEAVRADPELQRQRRELLDAHDDDRLPGPPGAFGTYLEREQALGRIRADVDPHVAAQVMLAALIGLSHAPIDPDRTDELLIASIDLYLTGLLPHH